VPVRHCFFTMKKKKTQARFKLKSTRKEGKRKKKVFKARKQEKKQQQKIEKGLTEICSNMLNLGIDRVKPSNSKASKELTSILESKLKLSASDSNDQNGILNSTSKFLLESGVDSSEVAWHSTRLKKRKKSSKKKSQKSFSMVKLLSSLPESDQTPTSTVENSLPITLIKPPSFHYEQRDAKKCYKKIIRNDRSSKFRSRCQTD